MLQKKKKIMENNSIHSRVQDIRMSKLMLNSVYGFGNSVYGSSSIAYGTGSSPDISEGELLVITMLRRIESSKPREFIRYFDSLAGKEQKLLSCLLFVNFSKKNEHLVIKLLKRIKNINEFILELLIFSEEEIKEYHINEKFLLNNINSFILETLPKRIKKFQLTPEIRCYLDLL